MSKEVKKAKVAGKSELRQRKKMVKEGVSKKVTRGDKRVFKAPQNRSIKNLDENRDFKGLPKKEPAKPLIEVNTETQTPKLLKGVKKGSYKTSSAKSRDIKTVGFSIGSPNYAGVKAAEKANKDVTSWSLSSIAAHVSDLNPTEDYDGEYDHLDLWAQRILDLIYDGIYVLEKLTKHEKFTCFRYFYRHNPVLGRILDLHSEIPISKLRLQAPRGVPRIVKDYVLNFYSKWMERCNFAEQLRAMVLNYFIYGESFLVVEDDYADFERELQDLTKLTEHKLHYTEEMLSFLADVEDRYQKDPASVPIEERRRYLTSKFPGHFTEGYSGPDRISPVQFYKIQQYFTNEDIDYEAIEYTLSSGLNALLRAKRTEESQAETLKDLGYTSGIVRLLEENESANHQILIDNDTYSGDPFILSLRKFERIGLVERVFDSCIAWDAAKRALLTKLRTLGHVGRIISAEDLSGDQLLDLQGEVQMMLKDPKYAIVVNYKISWDEVNGILKDELKDLSEATDQITEELSIGGGMPTSLISGDSQFSGDNIKIEILNTEYFTFKLKMQNLSEDKLMKPVALRKGLISIDEWGEPVLVSPKVTFGQVNLRASDYFDLLFSLYQKGSLNIEVIYDLLNLDPDDVIHALTENLWTLKSDKMNDVVSDVLRSISDDIASNTNVVSKVIEALNLIVTESEGGDEEDSGSSKRRRR